jgi:hypothetical protein
VIFKKNPTAGDPYKCTTKPSVTHFEVMEYLRNIVTMLRVLAFTIVMMTHTCKQSLHMHMGLQDV